MIVGPSLIDSCIGSQLVFALTNLGIAEAWWLVVVVVVNLDLN